MRNVLALVSRCRDRLTISQLLIQWTAVSIASVAIYSLKMRKCEYKRERDEFRQTLRDRDEQVSIKNKFIGALTHEMRNFVAAYGLHATK